MPNRVNKPSPGCAYNILTNKAQYPLSHYCHKSTPLTHVQLLVPRDPSVLSLQSCFLAIWSLACAVAEGYSGAELYTCLCWTLEGFMRFLQLTEVPQGPYLLLQQLSCPFGTTYKLHPIIQIITKDVKQYWFLTAFKWLPVWLQHSVVEVSCSTPFPWLLQQTNSHNLSKSFLLPLTSKL